MLDRLEFDRRDRRNLLVVVAVVAAVMAVVSEGTLGVRLAVGLIAALISGVVFVVSTVAINRFKPAHW
jgi:drug/metabolite transporter (DMT)-like permease